MEMRTCGAPCTAPQAQHLSGSHHLHGLYIDFGEVAIDGLEAVVVADHHQVAVGTHGTCDAHHPVEGAVHGLTHAQTDVHPAVGAVPSPTIG